MEHFAAVIAKTIMTCVAQLLTPARQVRTLLVNGEPSALADFGRSQEYRAPRVGQVHHQFIRILWPYCTHRSQHRILVLGSCWGWPIANCTSTIAATSLVNSQLLSWALTHLLLHAVLLCCPCMLHDPSDQAVDCSWWIWSMHDV
eukprot:COSAG01_NODE_171_length_23132_cov_53.865118_10_plen_145_part_00